MTTDGSIDRKLINAILKARKEVLDEIKQSSKDIIEAKAKKKATNRRTT